MALKTKYKLVWKYKHCQQQCASYNFIIIFTFSSYLFHYNSLLKYILLHIFASYILKYVNYWSLVVSRSGQEVITKMV